VGGVQSSPRPRADPARPRRSSPAAASDDAAALGVRPEVWPRDLVARPCSVSGAAWHRAGLVSGSAARVAYHAAWLAHLEAPADASLQPLVSIVIPAFEADATIHAAVRSALEQTYPRVEIIVVDDGSMQPLAPLLAHYGPGVRVIRQANGGVASARNAAVRATTADLVHFLDADDTLDPTCVDRKVDALRMVPDAEVCVSSYRSAGENSFKSADSHAPPAFGDEFCPTRDLLTCCVRRYAFQTSTVLAARCLLLEAGPMDERLLQGEDSHYWFQLARRDAKVVAIDRDLGTRSFVANSLTTQREENSRFAAVQGMLMLCGILGEVSYWRHLVPALSRFERERCWGYVTRDDHPLLKTLREELLEAVVKLPDAAGRGGLSAHPPSAMLREVVRNRMRIETSRGGSADRFSECLSAAAEQVLADSPPVTARDLEFWIGAQLGRRAHGFVVACFSPLYAWVDERMRQPDGAPWRSRIGEFDEIWRAHPYHLRWFFRTRPTARSVVLLLRYGPHRKWLRPRTRETDPS